MTTEHPSATENMPPIELDVQIAVDDTGIPSEEQFEHWVSIALAGRISRPTEMCIRIVGREESQTLNHEYRGKDAPTNVLSFEMEAPEDLPVCLLGDLVICADVVEHEANAQTKDLHHHWAHMVIHGTLHLLGFDHINDTDAEEMETLETQLLASLHIADPYTLKDE